MKKILLSVFYPLWFFLAKTWVGNIIMIPVCISPIPVLHECLSDNAANPNQSYAEGMATLSLLCSPFIGMAFMLLSDELESNYKKWNYKTEINRNHD